MENIIYGRQQARERGEIDWEHFDSKAYHIFLPRERYRPGTTDKRGDKTTTGGRVSLIRSSLIKNRPTICWPVWGKIPKLLATHNAVDYSSSWSGYRWTASSRSRQSILARQRSGGSSIIPDWTARDAPGTTVLKTGAVPGRQIHIPGCLIGFLPGRSTSHKPSS